MATNFAELGLDDALVRALEKKGYKQPTPIQAQSIPPILKGLDVLATAQTGTGKTASFALPILQILANDRAKRQRLCTLILTPTRELAEQIDRNIKLYSNNLHIKSVVVVGGVNINGQIRQLKQRPEIVVATPGRLMDLIQQKQLSLSQVELLVLDEADRMLDMGFIHEVKKIVAMTPKSLSLIHI